MEKRVEFISNGQKLTGLLEFPSGTVKAYALFAHCFTCDKANTADSVIVRALVEKGFAVLQFNSTKSENSDFSNANFASNLDDLKSAATFLKLNYAAPQLLVGHSIGGAAALAVASDIKSISAVATIGAPALSGYITQDITNKDDKTNPPQFILKGKSVLLMHSPVDTMVSINEAEKIYSHLKHPKSFISLDTADHFLSTHSDAVYVATVISSQADKYIQASEKTGETIIKPEKGTIVVSEKDHNFTVNVASDDHSWLADEPLNLGGKNLGPDPYEHLLAALGACTVMTLRMYAKHKKIDLHDIKVTLEHSKNHQNNNPSKESLSDGEQITRKVTLVGNLSEEQKNKLLVIANKCPVHQTLNNKLTITTTAQD
ncbi:bifunctional alpha/beta hydrolase/OsmC family protein [Colwellia sp. MSW7]|uniref:Bifunctional alpha/beta hydrolase/OsmC family protein n=1 Tax=Colwellia maritima TaxID=2912588 RepID=A0ABS9WX22_9GAMM|nr:bifunctional alpha/beta hydrolase/OsmC family protein [Colwellia maritima]MCI2282524.1 bifunctional alpha/beta hydrolase/OsmC family protein [Colwellia maritima]